MFYLVKFIDGWHFWFRGEFVSPEQAKEFAEDEMKELRRHPGYKNGEYLNWVLVKCEEV